MAKGKYAVRAANRRYEAATQHIDRLTDTLAENKRRAREAEATAARLQGIEKLLPKASAKNDKLLAAALESLNRWKRIAREDYDRRAAAYLEIRSKLIPDLLLTASKDLTTIDKAEFLQRRYPALISALMAGAEAKQTVNGGVRLAPSWSPFQSLEHRLSDEDLRRFQRLAGERGIMGSSDRDASEVLDELLEAKQLEFSSADIRELMSDVLGESS